MVRKPPEKRHSNGGLQLQLEHKIFGHNQTEITMSRKVLNLTLTKICLLLLIVNCGVVASFITPNGARLGGIQKLHTAEKIFHKPTLFATQTNQVSTEAIEGGDATIQTSIFNLAKSIIGAGVLSLPSGVAFFADDPKALIPSSIICAVFGLAAAYSFSSVGKICQETKSKSFQEAWGNTVSKNSAWVISASITAMCFLASLAYSIIIGDSFTSLAKVFIIIFFFVLFHFFILSLVYSDL